MPTEEEYKQAICDALDEEEGFEEGSEFSDELRKRMLTLAGRDPRWLVYGGPVIKWEDGNRCAYVDTVGYYWDDSDKKGEPDEFHTSVWSWPYPMECIESNIREEAQRVHDDAVRRCQDRLVEIMKARKELERQKAESFAGQPIPDFDFLNFISQESSHAD